MEFIDDILHECTNLRGPNLASNRPMFHLMPISGWMNDPNGPIFYNGRFHMFYQQLTTGVTWNYGIVWGHATSTDLVYWEHLPPAIVPTHGGLDANGCFSGCCVIDDTTGLPVILYTGVRLRTNDECGPLPPSEVDLNLEFIESQCFAIADPKCEKLTVWHKSKIPFLSHPPAGMQLTGWRDPFILFDKQQSSHRQYRMLIGSGIKGVGGTVLIYKSHSLASGWTYHGLLCVGSMEQTYAMWECPILVQLNVSTRLKPHGTTRSRFYKPGYKSTSLDITEEGVSTSAEFRNSFLHYTHETDQENGDYFFSISPDAPNNPVLYWIGDFVGDRFLLEGAEGPFRLDLGDILYAPNVLEDENGRHILWAWLQELPRNGNHDYAGCLTVPRLLSLHNNNLIQEPAPEIAELRNLDKCWHIQEYINLYPGQHTPLEVVGGQHLDIEVRFDRVDSMAVGMLFRPLDTNVGQNALLVFHWENKSLEVIREIESTDCLDSLDKIGGLLDIRPGDPLELRILIDQSCIEVFSNSGEVLSTRIYRGEPVEGSDAAIDFVAYGGAAHLSRLAAYEMKSIWDRSQLKISSAAMASNGILQTEQEQPEDMLQLSL